MMTRMINIYDQTDLQTSESHPRKIDWHHIIWHGGGTILAGDMNAHSCRWDPRCKQQHDATFWEEILDEYGLQIGNDGRPTHHPRRNGAQGESTVDLTMATQLITRWTTLKGETLKAPTTR